MPTIVITGATSGLGKIAAVDLAQSDTTLILPARSRERADAAKAAILEKSPTATVEIVLADLTDLSQVRVMARDIRSNHPSIDVLVNNAGVHAFSQRVTTDGYPEMIAVNYLAPWLLTSELLPSLKAAENARIVTVASEASRRHGTFDLTTDLTDTAPFTARESSPLYGKSKLLDIMFALELAGRLEGTRVTSTALDPGFNVTGLGRELGFAAPLERVLTALHIGDPAKGAALISTLAVDPAFDGVSGAYFTVKGTRRLTPVSPADDETTRRELWERTEALLAGL